MDQQIDVVVPALHAAQRWITAYAILLARPMALLSISPIFTRVQFSNLLKGVVATALLFPMWPPVAAQLESAQPGTFSLLLIVIKESLIGGALGLPLGLPFWALLAAGDIVDQQRGATQGRLNDPAGFGDMSVTGTLFLMCGVMLLCITGRINTIPDVLYASWATWRPLEMVPMPDDRAASLALHMLDGLESEALTLAMPIMLTMLLTDAAMLLVARIAPQLRVDDLSLAVRNLAFFIIMPLYAGFLLIYALRSESGLGHGLGLLAPVLPPSLHGIPAGP